MENQDALDCLIVGGGPAGLLAGVYLARFRRKVAIVSDGNSRALLIPQSHNYPGSINGLSGKDILQSLQKQVRRYSTPIYRDTIIQIKKIAGIFYAFSQNQVYQARKIILATGIANREPHLPFIHQAFMEGLIRHCMLCDAYEVQGKKVAIIGWGRNVIKETCFMLNYTRDLTLFNLGKKISAKDCAFLKKHSVRICEKGINRITHRYKKILIYYADQETPLIYDTLYSAMGYLANSKLAKSLRIKLDASQCVVTNAEQQSSLSGFYAIGDVAVGLKQMVTGFSHAVSATTAIHNHLTTLKPR